MCPIYFHYLETFIINIHKTVKQVQYNNHSESKMLVIVILVQLSQQLSTLIMPIIPFYQSNVHFFLIINKVSYSN